MKVVLAGFNVEAAILEHARERFGEVVTPEVISASYARISRDPRSVGMLRREARRSVERARASNERIVFGFGHASIAEHAVLNVDVTGVSRLAVEGIEHFRLASFTEKSQRYIRLDRDFVVPVEVRAEKLERQFRALVASLHRSYEAAVRAIAATGAELGVAKEDARYFMPLATATQLGMTVNARELEYMIGRLAAHPLDELRRFSSAAYRMARTHIPSLVRHPVPSRHVADMGAARVEIMKGTSRRIGSTARTGQVRLIDVTPDAEERLAASIIFSSGGGSLERAARIASRIAPDEREQLIAMTMRRLGPNDAVWREFETVQFVYELVVSASCYAQLKRHRIATLIPQPYDLSLGLSIPETFVGAHATALLERSAARVERFYRAHMGCLGPATEYALLNAHRRRALLVLNLRELYHFSRLRSDESAQWEIRRVSDEMARLAAMKVPAGARWLGGKDAFADRIRSART
jgi:flavin-dependent thymidylate synthase